MFLDPWAIDALGVALIPVCRAPLCKERGEQTSPPRDLLARATRKAAATSWGFRLAGRGGIGFQKALALRLESLTGQCSGRVKDCGGREGGGPSPRREGPQYRRLGLSLVAPKYRDKPLHRGTETQLSEI